VSSVRTTPLVLACLLLVGLAGCSGEQGATEDHTPGAGSDDEPAAGWAVARDFTVDYAYYVEECNTGFNTYSRVTDTTVTIPRPGNVTTLDLTFTWVAASPLVETLRFALVGPDGFDTAVLVEGSSPLTWRLDGQQLQASTPDPWIAGTPVDCGRPAGVGSAPEQGVHVDGQWS
jgi:hypothetical protein